MLGYYNPTTPNEPHNENVVKTQKKPNLERIELQTAPSKDAATHPSFYTVNY